MDMAEFKSQLELHVVEGGSGESTKVHGWRYLMNDEGGYNPHWHKKILTNIFNIPPSFCFKMSY